MTIRAIVHLADSSLTYCVQPLSDTYAHIDSVIALINAAFGGPYVAVSFTPFLLAGTQDLGTVPFLRHNPAAAPAALHGTLASIIDPEPGQFALYQNYPNPFNPTTTISFDLPSPAIVTVTVYTVLGQEVATLIDHQSMDQGRQEVVFDASHLSTGLYLYRISAGGFVETKKMVLMK